MLAKHQMTIYYMKGVTVVEAPQTLRLPSALQRFLGACQLIVLVS